MQIIKKIDELRISGDQTITDAISKLNRSKFKILFIVNKNKSLIGSITDGDIRRTIIKKKKLNLKIIEVMNKNVKFFFKNKYNEYNYKELFKYKIFCIPVVNKSKKILFYIIKGEEKVKKADNTVFLMAGGKGLRLRPLTKFVPKPLLKINNITIIERIIENFKEQGFDNFIISIKYLGNKIIKFLKKRKNLSTKIQIISEKKFLGTAGSLSLINKRNNVKFPILLTNSDLITNIDYKKLINFHIKNKSDLTICVRSQIFEMPYGEIYLKGNRVKKIIEKPISNSIINTGVYVLSKKIIRNLKYNKRTMMNDLINQLLKKDYKIMSFPIYENWIDVGNRDQLKKARGQH